RAEELHRWDQIALPGSWALPLKGMLDLGAQRVQLVSADEPESVPLALEFRGENFLSRPVWEAGVRFNQVPLAALVDTARHAGIAVRNKPATEGGVSGEVTYPQDGGLHGEVELRDAALTLPDAEPLRAKSAKIAIGEGTVHLDPATVEIGEKESA